MKLDRSAERSFADVIADEIGDARDGEITVIYGPQGASAAIEEPVEVGADFLGFQMGTKTRAIIPFATITCLIYGSRKSD